MSKNNVQDSSQTIEFDYSFETVVEALLYLFTRYEKQNEPTVRRAIIEHMGMLSQHPEVKSESLKNTAGRLGVLWTCDCETKDQNASKKRLNSVVLH